MNRIIKEHYPAAKLPEDLREGLDPTQEVRVTVEVAQSKEDAGPAWAQESRRVLSLRVLSLDEIFALRRPPYRSGEEIDAEIRRQRDEWDD